MALYLNELAPWERKNEYYNNIQLGKDSRTQTDIINRSAKAMIASQLVSTNAIISSQDRIREGIDSVSNIIESVEDGIYSLKAAFEWGISEVVWQIEQNRVELQSILKVLSAPLDTQAKELRKRAEEAYANGWYDDALQDFLESEIKNRYDFSIHISIGMIYLFNKIDKKKALLYFDNAIKYAAPKSKYHTSFALLHKALIKRDAGNLEEAEECAREATELTPDFAEALYQCAQYNALLNRPDKSMALLTKAIAIDINYCNKSSNDEAFAKFRPQINNVFEYFRSIECENARNKLSIFSNKLEQFDSLLKVIKDVVNSKDEELRKGIVRVSELFKRNSYCDYKEASSMITELHWDLDNLRNNIIAQIDNLIKSHETEITNANNHKKAKIHKSESMLRGWIWTVFLIVSIILGLRGCIVRLVSNEQINPFWALIRPFWALIWITGIGVALYYSIYWIAISVTKSDANVEASNQIAIEQSNINKLKGYINKFIELQ